jgi:CHASE2 domain-containing sensor protein
MYPRERIAEGIEKIALAGAKLIVMDAILQRKGDSPTADARLARALAATPSIIGRHTEVTVDTDPQGRRQKRKMSVRPIPLFAEAAKGVIPLEVRRLNGMVLEIALSNLRDVFSSENVPLLAPLRQFVSSEIVEPGGFDFINFYGGPSTLTSLSLADVIGPNATIAPTYFKDRVVLLGVISDAGAGIEAGKDTFLTSISKSPMYGVEIHATIVANLLEGSWIRRLPLQVESLLMSLLAFGLSYTVLAASSRKTVLLLLGTAWVWFGFSFYAFCRLYYFVPGVTLFLFLTPLLLGLSVLARNQQE